jgi:HEAT repeat protein
MFENFLAALISGDEAISEQAARSLASLSEDQLEPVFAALRMMLDDPEPKLRWWAVRAICEINLREAPALLVIMLADPNLEVRQCAALALRLRPDPAALPVLLDLLENPDPMLTRLAGDALAVLGSFAVPGLLDRLHQGSQKARLIAIRTLAHISDIRAVPDLFAALDDKSMLIEYWANEALQRMGIGMTFFQP